MIDLLIVDDDVHWTAMLAAMAEAMGLSCERIHNGQQALKEVGRLKPRVAVLDIMMPGMDGLSLCKILMSNPLSQPMKVIIASNKPFQAEKDEARRCGAAFFFEKTSNVTELMKTIRSLVDALKSKGGGDLVEQPSGRVPVFRVHVWGCRGQGGVGPDFATSCLSVDFGPRRLILDAGTGLLRLVDGKPTPENDPWLLLTHYHMDHVSGLAGIGQLAEKRWSIAGPQDPRNPPDAVLRRTLPKELVARMNVLAISESSFTVQPGLAVRSLLTRHPGNTLAYRLEYQGRVIVYCPDNEIETERTKSDFSGKLLEFARGADLLIHDARYLDDDLGGHPQEGHSGVMQAVSLAIEAGARRLMLFHMDASYSEDTLLQALRNARLSAASAHSPLQVFMAVPGKYLDV